ncbi:MAG: hypothetical protein ACLVJ6_08455 [Merdibacter sp.]
MTSGGPGDATHRYDGHDAQGISDGFYNQGAAFGVCFFVVVMILSAIMNTIMQKWSDSIQ